MQVVYALQDFPEEWTSAIFLAGPTPRAEHPVDSWRPEAIKFLEDEGFDGVVIVPEAEGGKWAQNYLDQIEWETKGLNLADVVVFWVPRDLETMPAFTTNVEFGRWVDTLKLVLGHPKEAPKTRYLDALLDEASQGHEEWHPTLEGTLRAAMARVGEGDLRRGGERYVPLHVWQTPMFQGWYASLKENGNRLDEAKLLWTFVMPKARMVFSWVLWVKVWIEAEGRYKDIEWVFSRTDMSAVVLYQSWVPDKRGEITGAQYHDVLKATELVLIREFRSPVRNADGYVHEIPGGSSVEDKTPLEVAKSEVAEETGLKLATTLESVTHRYLKTAARRELHAQTGLVVASQRFQEIGTRQVASTLSSHHVHLFAVELAESEMEQVRQLIAAGATQGVEEDTELTYLEIKTFDEVLTDGLLDWSMVGMISQALLG